MKEFLKIWLPIILLIVGAFWLTSKFIKPAPTKALTIATGREGGSYYAFAERYKLLLEAQDIKVELITSAGSLETIKLLEEKKADIGFVQGGTLEANASDYLEAIASIFYEPLWLFAKKSKTPLQYMQSLKDKRISIGEDGSGTQMLVNQITHANGITMGDSAKILHLGLKDSYEAFKKDEIDAFFAVVSAETPLIQTLLLDESVEAVSLKRIKAYEKHFSYLSGITLPEGSIDLIKNLPSKDIELLATTATLAVHKDVDDTLVRLVAKVVKGENKREDGFPSIEHLELPLNPQAKQYLEHGDSILEKFFPYWIAANIDRLKIMLIPLITLLLPIFKGFMPLYRWRIRSKIYKWYKKLDTIDQEFNTEKKEALQSLAKEVELLQKEIKEHVDVPLAYMSEYYMLKTHVDFVHQQITERLRRMKYTEKL